MATPSSTAVKRPDLYSAFARPLSWPRMRSPHARVSSLRVGRGSATAVAAGAVAVAVAVVGAGAADGPLEPGDAPGGGATDAFVWPPPERRTPPRAGRPLPEDGGGGAGGA